MKLAHSLALIGLASVLSVGLLTFAEDGRSPAVIVAPALNPPDRPGGVDAPAAKGEPIEQTTARLRSAIPPARLVAIGTVESVNPVAQTHSMPPSIISSVSVKVTEMLRGEKQETLRFSYVYREGQGFAPAAEQKVLVVGMPVVRPAAVVPPARVAPPNRLLPPAMEAARGSNVAVTFLGPASDELVAVAREAVKAGPTSRPETQPAGETPDRLCAAATQAKLVLVATVEAVKETGQLKTDPPVIQMDVTLKDPTILKGPKPDTLTMPYWAVQGQGFFPKAGQKVLAVVNEVLAGPIMGGPPTPLGQPRAVRTQLRIVVMGAATDENVAAVKKAIEGAKGPADPGKGPGPGVGMVFPPGQGGPGVGGIRMQGNGGVLVLVPAGGGAAGAQPVVPVVPGDIPPVARQPIRIGGGVQVAPPIAPIAPVEGDPPVAVAPGDQPQPKPEDPKAKLVDAVTTGQLVLVGTVAQVVQGPAAMSEPPILSMTVTLKDVEMLKGAKPEKLEFGYRVVQGRGFEPQVGQKVLIVSDAAAGGGGGPGVIRPQPMLRPMIQPLPRPEIPAPPLPGDEMMQQGPGPAVPPARPPIVARPLPIGGGGIRVILMVEATKENVDLARQALKLPAGWTMDKDSKPVSPWAALGGKAWPKDAKGATAEMVCSKSGRPALLAGKGVTLKVEQVPPAVAQKWKNDYGDGKFKVTVTNTTDKPQNVPALLTNNGKDILWSDSLLVLDSAGKAHLLGGAGQVAAAVKPVKLDPNASVTAEVDTLKLTGISWPRGGSRVSFRFCLGELCQENFFYYFSDLHDKMRGQAGGGPAVTPGASGAEAGWTNVFAGEQWYKGQTTKEQEFTGTLEAIPEAGGASTLMRTSYYRLGSRNIYTGAKKVLALDGLVGKKVTIRGKPYDINLEGQAVSEIWPAAVRPADGSTPDTPKVAPSNPGALRLTPEPLRPLDKPDLPQQAPIPR